MRPLLLAACVLLLSSCQLAGVSADAVDDLTVRYRVSFGECIGYCLNQLEVTETQTTLVRRSYTPTDPELRRSVPTEPAIWDAIERLNPVAQLLGLDTTYGCPDCADGGAATLEAALPDRVYRVTYEYRIPPPQLEAFDALMHDRYQAILETMQE